jgi:hypothetical protein
MLPLIDLQRAKLASHLREEIEMSRRLPLLALTTITALSLAASASRQRDIRTDDAAWFGIFCCCWFRHGHCYRRRTVALGDRCVSYNSNWPGRGRFFTRSERRASYPRTGHIPSFWRWSCRCGASKSQKTVNARSTRRTRALASAGLLVLKRCAGLCTVMPVLLSSAPRTMTPRT